MLRFLIKRLISLIVTLFAVSVVAFAIIQLPPGDFLTSYLTNLAADGQTTSQEVVDRLRENYGLDQPVFIQYAKWMGNILFKGDFGQSFEWNRPVEEVVCSRMTHDDCPCACDADDHVDDRPAHRHLFGGQAVFAGDYVATLIGFIGVAVPGLSDFAGADVYRLQVFQPERRRLVLAGLRERATGLARSCWICSAICGFR